MTTVDVLKRILSEIPQTDVFLTSEETALVDTIELFATKWPKIGYYAGHKVFLNGHGKPTPGALPVAPGLVLNGNQGCRHPGICKALL